MRTLVKLAFLVSFAAVPASAQLSFPYSGSWSGSAPMFDLLNTGSGTVVAFTGNSNVSAPMVGINNGTMPVMTLSGNGLAAEYYFGGGTGIYLAGAATTSGHALDVLQQCVPPIVSGQCTGTRVQSLGTIDAIGLWVNSGIGVKADGLSNSLSVGVLGTGGTGLKAATNVSGGYGLVTSSSSGTAALATTTNGIALSVAASTGGLGILSQTSDQNAIRGFSSAGTASAIYGSSMSTNTGNGITGFSQSRNGVEGSSSANGASGVYGENTAMAGYGVAGRSSGTGIGIYGHNWGGGGYAGYFDGKVHVNGNFHVNGTLSKLAGSFKIDHPLDPSNKFLVHSFVESPEMLNVYSGIAQVDSNGNATVTLPSYWSALNVEPRYQLTAIGAPGNLFISREYRSSDNSFQIGGAAPNSRVSWQLTGVRNDPYARANRIEPEVMKPAAERGSYLTPELYGISQQGAGRNPIGRSSEVAIGGSLEDPLVRYRNFVERDRATTK